MGNNLTLSKKGSEIDDLIRLTHHELVKIHARAVHADDSQHLSLWEVYSKSKESASVRPGVIYNPKTEEWNEVSSSSAYILLIVGRGESLASAGLPLSAQRLFDSLSLLTPSDMYLPFAQGNTESEFSFKLYNMVAKCCSKECRALSVVKSVELENWLVKKSPEACVFLHTGYYITQEKIKSGSRIWLPGGESKLNLPPDLQRFVDNISQKIPQSSPRNFESEFFINLFFGEQQPDGPEETAVIEPRNERFMLDLGGLTLAPFHQLENPSTLRETSRKLAKLREFESDCSCVWAERLYVSGFKVACDLERLLSLGITHIINCAGDYCPNEHTSRFVYQTFFIKDSKTENIECIFYEAIEFIERAFSEQGKVLVHCMQGVSRSVTVAIAFLIHKLRLSYAQAFDTVRQSRGIASPNIGFISQLMTFEKRILGPFDSHLLPKVFVAGSHQVEDARRIVFRMLIDIHFYKAQNNIGRNSANSIKSDKKTRLQDIMRSSLGRGEPTARKEGRLDPRSVFIICGRSICYIWAGKQTCKNALALYILKAEEYLSKLQRFESASSSLVTLWQGEEPASFWEIFGLVERPEPEPYIPCTKWSNWFINFEEESRIRSARSHKSRMAYAEHEVIKDKPAMFIFPYYLEPLYVLDLDDLREDCMAVLCDRNKGIAHVWQGSLFRHQEDDSQISVQEFVQAVLGFFEREDTVSVEQIWQQAGEESDEFFNYFR